MEPLVILVLLRSALKAPAARSDIEEWWRLFVELEAALETDAAYSRRERGVVDRLREGMGLVIAAVQDGYVPDFARATAPLSALELSLKRRAKHLSKNGTGISSINADDLR